ncbi:MAG TPA: hypothetical protein VHP33_22855 [Polyangiaceae bacterium]|nr:hypothetical protein [Polyangiaceae bacterium]
MLGLNAGELTLFAILVFAVISARFWPAAGARIAERLSGGRKEQDNPKSADERR